MIWRNNSIFRDYCEVEWCASVTLRIDNCNDDWRVRLLLKRDQAHTHSAQISWPKQIIKHHHHHQPLPLSLTLPQTLLPPPASSTTCQISGQSDAKQYYMKSNVDKPIGTYRQFTGCFKFYLRSQTSAKIHNSILCRHYSDTSCKHPPDIVYSHTDGMYYLVITTHSIHVIAICTNT